MNIFSRHRRFVVAVSLLVTGAVCYGANRVSHTGGTAETTSVQNDGAPAADPGLFTGGAGISTGTDSGYVKPRGGKGSGGKSDSKTDSQLNDLVKKASALKEPEPPPTCANCRGVFVRGRYDPVRIGQFNCNGSVCRTCSGVTPATACTAFCLNGKENLWGSPKDGLPDTKTFTKAELAKYGALFAQFGFKVPESCTCNRSMFASASSYGMGYSDGSCRGCVALPSPPSTEEDYYFSACRQADWCSKHCR